MSQRNERFSWAIVLGLFLSVAPLARSQSREVSAADQSLKQLKNLEESIRFGQEMSVRIADGQFLFQRLGDLAEVDCVRYTGPAPRVVKNPTGQGAGNPVVINAYTFIPRKSARADKLPLLNVRDTTISIVRGHDDHGVIMFAPLNEQHQVVRMVEGRQNRRLSQRV